MRRPARCHILGVILTSQTGASPLLLHKAKNLRSFHGLDNRDQCDSSVGKQTLHVWGRRLLTRLSWLDWLGDPDRITQQASDSDPDRISSNCTGAFAVEVIVMT